ncbi:MAG TPA: transcription antitermination factor NusB [Acidimicrobiales bacterium]|nr:MAG: transcription antitermination factor NusB [Actinobacteria bacterium 21-73-9]HQU26455.1 transcription antitermination factor NusB [Acidimicrobiales bacterium]
MSLGPERHRARERALEILYEAAIKERPAREVLATLPLAPDPYTAVLVDSAEAHRDRAEALIAECAIDWPLERIALVDRLVMTLAVGEMLLADPPPLAVILDEAVELAKVFSTEGSASFVNGVLATLARRLTD